MRNRRRRPEVLVLSVGGTIDKDYGSGISVVEFHIGSPYAPIVLNRCCGEQVRFHALELMRKDSTVMTDADRNQIASTCRTLPDTAIIITHGTDTMRQTAEVLHRAKLRKTIVLTGALRPAAMLGSDADLNLGLALGTALWAPAGVYIAMNGSSPWRWVNKQPRTGRFVRTE